MEEKGQGGGAK
jgi:hypothetical protein